MAAFTLLSSLLAASVAAYPQGAAPPDNTVYKQTPSFNLVADNLGTTDAQCALFANGTYVDFYHVDASNNRLAISSSSTVNKLAYYLNGTDLDYSADAATLQFPAAPSNGFPYFGVVVSDERPEFAPLQFVGGVSGSNGWSNYTRADKQDAIAYAPVAQGGQLYGCYDNGLDATFIEYGGDHVNPVVPDGCTPIALIAHFLGN